MALIGKIREKSGIAVTVIALGLLLFIVGGDLISSNSFLLNNDQNKLGEINGQEIKREVFEAKVDELKNNFMLNNKKSPNDQEMNSIREQAWAEFLFEYGVKKESDKLGLSVTAEEKYDYIQGKNVNASIKQYFTNPQTGQFDRTQIIAYLQNFQKLPPEQQLSWISFEKQLLQERYRTKFENLLKASVYVTKEEAKRDHLAQNSKANIKFVYIPYFTIADTTVKVGDGQLEEYLNKNKDRYKSDESVGLEYVAFPITPSAEDSVKIKQEMLELKAQFVSTENDTAFANGNSDVQNNSVLANRGQLPPAFLQNVSNIQIDSVYGPFLEGNTYKIYKVSEERKDTIYSIKASHILFEARRATATPEQKAEALKKAKETIARLQKGEPFEILAMQLSTDPGSARNGGDLGWFSEGMMVKEFNKAAFDKGTPGLIAQPIETDFGYHIIKVTEPKSNKKFALFSIERQLTASETTRDGVYNRATAFAADAKDEESFNKAIKKDSLNLFKQKGDNITKSSQNINALANARSIVRWAFDEAKVGKVSPIFDPENNYVVCLLTKKREKGTGKVEDFKDELTSKVRNEEKSKIIIEKLNTLKGSSLEDIQKAYGADAQVNTANDVTLQGGSIPNLGFDPIATGKAFGLKKGKRTKAFAGENGVVILELLDLVPAVEIADYTQNRTTAAQSQTYSVGYQATEAIKEASNVKDNRYRFY